MKKTLIYNAPQIVTPTGSAPLKGSAMGRLQILEDGAIYMEGGIIKETGPSAELHKKYSATAEELIDADGSAILPGFIDSHTHFVFGGYREKEFLKRLSGASYLDIMRMGGGIRSTVKATREASFETLKETGRVRLDDMLSQGVTSVEGKSGYGLDRDCEMKQLRVMADLNESHPVDIYPTYLGAHALPDEYRENRETYLNLMINDILPEIRKDNLADFCDVFCEEEAFTAEESRRLLSAAKEMGFSLKIHADEINDLDGAALASELGAVSADHLLQISDRGIEKLAASSTIATLLPCTAFCLNKPFAPGRKLIDRGCAVALATDFNPGSSFTNSIPLLLSLAVIKMGLSMEEAVTALTLNSAAALGIGDRTGTIEAGKKADLVFLDYPDYRFLVYHTGKNIVKRVMKNGTIVFDKQ